MATLRGWNCNLQRLFPERTVATCNSSRALKLDTTEGRRRERRGESNCRACKMRVLFTANISPPLKTRTRPRKSCPGPSSRRLPCAPTSELVGWGVSLISKQKMDTMCTWTLIKIFKHSFLLRKQPLVYSTYKCVLIGAAYFLQMNYVCAKYQGEINKIKYRNWDQIEVFSNWNNVSPHWSTFQIISIQCRLLLFQQIRITYEASPPIITSKGKVIPVFTGIGI